MTKKETRFYYNEEMNLCADRNWVVEYLFMGGMVESREDAENGLDIYRSFFGWQDCEVSNTIEELFKYA